MRSPAVADQPVLDRELRRARAARARPRVGRATISSSVPCSVPSSRSSGSRSSRLSRVTWSSVLTARDPSRPTQRLERTSKSALSFAASSGSSRGARLAARERSPGYEPSPHAAEHPRVVSERTCGPGCLGVPEGREDALVLAAHEVGELEPNPVALVPGAAVLVRLGCVLPAVVLEERRDPWQVVEPAPRCRRRSAAVWSSRRRSRPPSRRRASTRPRRLRGAQRRTRARPAGLSPRCDT